jgi:hypothetical protein
MWLLVDEASWNSNLHSAQSGPKANLQQEIRRHDFSHFVDEPPSVAQGGRGVVAPGCPTCRKRIKTMSQFLDHIANDVLPLLLDRLSSERQPHDR